ncbi:glycosyltransferase family 4 protein [Ancylobacter defluvii]|uniref:Glycosyl transferase family 1 n=1 Tax=Ancylobacter defluvii TaxID=1282440 RepID=A0A9W6JWT9_9HYPH|nr:glycosyltransferase family 4 protein [Ancylobacter defluvii]MBS7589025.1 glycosyltransferase family 4 protein [Ancylobacter defluvii]GLK84632.1 glycosyl transferase family 1 [Ancylobacter defluvii]
MARGGSELKPDPANFPDPARIEAVAPNLKRRLSGVTATLERVVPVQARALRIAALGPKLAAGVPRIGWTDLRHFWQAPPGRPARIWHARRNIEMLAGVVLRDMLRMKLRLVFTSASQRHHTGWTRFLISRMDAVISTSGKTAGYLKRPSTVIHHGIDAETFRPAPDRVTARAALGLPDLRLIGCFGRIRAQKGTDVFVDALMQVLSEHPGWGGVVLGRAVGSDAGFLDGLKAKVKAAGLEDRLLFPGEVETSATPDWYRALDLYVAPQRWEGFGVTPIEAMACGVPVIATRVGAFEELVIEGITGALVPPGDVAAMAAAMRNHIELGDAARAAMGEQARAHALAEFSLEREASKINAVYEAAWRG